MQGGFGFGFGFACHWLKNWHEILNSIIKCSNCNHNYFQLSFETPKTGFAAVGLVASLLKPSLCSFFSDVSPVLLPSICNLM